MIKKYLSNFRKEIEKSAGLPSIHIPTASSQIIKPGLKAAASPVGLSMGAPILNQRTRSSFVNKIA